MKKTKINFIAVSFLAVFMLFVVFYYAVIKNTKSKKVKTSHVASSLNGFSIEKCSALNDFINHFETLSRQEDQKKKHISDKDFFVKNINDPNNKSFIEALESQTDRFDRCGVESIAFLESIYNDMQLLDKAKQLHDKLIKLARDKNNYAINAVCINPANDKEKLIFCGQVLNNAQYTNSDYIWNVAVDSLIGYYYQKDNVKSLSDLCKKYPSNHCYWCLNSALDLVYDKKSYNIRQYDEQVIDYYEKYFNKKDRKKIEKKDLYNPKYLNLIDLYVRTKSTNKLLGLCENRDNLDKSEIRSCAINLYFAAEDLYKSKQYSNALRFLKFDYYYNKDNYLNFKEHSARLIAEIYFEGEGVSKNPDQSIKWYQDALRFANTKTSQSEIYHNLAIIFYYKHDLVNMHLCYKKSAMRGNVLSQVSLALSYLRGDGVIQDYVEAYAWASVAMALGVHNDNQSKLVRRIKQKSKLALLYNEQPGSDLKMANLLAKQYYNDVIQLNNKN